MSETTLTLLEISGITAEAIGAQLQAHASTLREVTLSLKGYARHLDLSAFPWESLVHLETVTLRRFRVPAALLAHLGVRTLKLHECRIGAAAEVHTGPHLETLEFIDCNPEVETLVIEGPKFTAFDFRQDQDAAESGFATLRLACPNLQALHFRAEVPARLEFVGTFPLLRAENLRVMAGQFATPALDVSRVQPACAVSVARVEHRGGQ